MAISRRELLILLAFAVAAMAGLKFASGWMLPIVKAVTGLVLICFAVRAVVDRGSRQAFAIGFTLTALAYSAASFIDGPRTRPKDPDRMFGTDRVLQGLHDALATSVWYRFSHFKRTMAVVPGFESEAPAGATSVVRLEKSEPESPMNLGRSEEDVARSSTIVLKQLSESELRFSPPTDSAAYVPSELVNFEQVREYQAVDIGRRHLLMMILNTDEGRKAVSEGTPLSALDIVSYSVAERPYYRDFQSVGYSLAALLLGYIGGSFARYVYGVRENERANR
jgi:hypothetical protein